MNKILFKIEETIQSQRDRIRLTNKAVKLNATELNILTELTTETGLNISQIIRLALTELYEKVKEKN